MKTKFNLLLLMLLFAAGTLTSCDVLTDIDEDIYDQSDDDSDNDETEDEEENNDKTEDEEGSDEDDPISDPIAAPYIEVAGGLERARVRWTPMSDTRIDKYQIYVDGTLKKSYDTSAPTSVDVDVDGVAVTYFEHYVTSMDYGYHDIYMVCYPNTEEVAASYSDTISIFVYTQESIDALPAVKVEYMSYNAFSGVTTITWSNNSYCSQVDLTYFNNGVSQDVTITDFSETLQLQGTVAGENITYTCLYAPNGGYELVALSNSPTTIEVQDEYARAQLLPKPFTGFDETGITATHGYKLLGDAVVLSSYALSKIFDSSNTLLSLDSGSSTNGLFTNSDCTGLALTIDLGSEYILTEFTYWQRRFSQIYAHINLKSWRMWGATAEAWDTELNDGAGGIKEEYQLVSRGYHEGWTLYPDFDAMSADGLWVLLCEEEEQIAPGETIASYVDYDYYGVTGYGGATLTIPYGYTVSTTGGASFTLNQISALAGHTYYITEETPIQYVRLELLEAWNGGSNFGIAEIDFKGEM